MERVPLTRFYGSTRARSRTRALKREGSCGQGPVSVTDRMEMEAAVRRRERGGGGLKVVARPLDFTWRRVTA